MRKRFNCPFCFDGRYPRTLSVHPDSGFYKCFRASCGKKGKLDEWTKRAIGEEIFRRPKNPEDNRRSSITEAICPTPEAKMREALTLPEPNRKIKPGCVAWKYLKSRELDPKYLQPYVRVHDNYILFPIYQGSQLIYYTGRKMYGPGLRHKDAGGSGRGIFVPYGMSKVKYKKLAVVEGVIDSLSIYSKINFPCIALLGVSYATYKLNLLLGYLTTSSKVIMLLDPGVYTDLVQLVWNLKNHCQVTIRLLKGIRDPGDMTARELAKLVS